jgi:hypothetical protein
VNTATGTKESGRLDEENSRRLKLVPPCDPSSGRKKLRIGICDGLFSPGTGTSEKLSQNYTSPVDVPDGRRSSEGSGKWLAFAALGLVLGYFIGKRRK